MTTSIERDIRKMREKESPKPNDMIRIVVRPYGSALPLGCFAFAVGRARLPARSLQS